MRSLDNAIPVGSRRAEAGSSESATLTGLRRAFDIPRLFRSRFRRDLGVTAFAQLGVFGINALTGLLAARLLGPQVRGQLAALTLWPGALIFLTHPGTDAALVFHVGKQRFRFSEVWTAGTVLSILQTLLVIPVGLFVVPLALRSYPAQVRHLAIIFLCSAPSIIFVSQLTSLLQGKLRLDAYNLVRTIAPAVYAVGLLALFFLHRPNLRDVVAFQIAGAVAAAGAGYAFLSRQQTFQFQWNVEACKSLLSFGWRTQLSNVTSFANQRLDQLLLSLFVPPRQLGLYVVAVTVASALGFIPQAAGIVTYAAGSNLNANDAGRIISRSFQACLVCLGLGCSLLFVIVPWLIPFAFGRGFAGAVLACRILLPGTVAFGLSHILYDGARALGHPALPAHAEGCSLIVTLGCLYLLVPRFGFVGAALASTLAYGTSLVAALVLLKRRAGLGWRDLIGLSNPTLRRVFSDGSR